MASGFCGCADDITVSIVRETCPEGLFRYILDAVLFPTQIIVTGELRKKDHTWLKALSSRLEKQDMKELLDRVYNLTHKFDRELADAVLEVSMKANLAAVGGIERR